MQLRAVEPAVDLRELVVHVVDLEVAPLAVALVAPDLRVELAERRRHLLDRAVVAERREVVIGIDAAEQRVRRLIEEVAEEILERPVARVGARGQSPAVVELAVHEERELRVGRGVEVVRAVLALQQLDRAVRVVARQGQIGHADVEPVLVLELDVAQIQLAVAFLVEHGHLDGVHARRQDLLRDEAAVVGDGHRAARHVDGVTQRDRAAAHGHGAARERNVAQPELVLAIRDAQRAILHRGLDRRRRLSRSRSRIRLRRGRICLRRRRRRLRIRIRGDRLG